MNNIQNITESILNGADIREAVGFSYVDAHNDPEIFKDIKDLLLPYRDKIEKVINSIEKGSKDYLDSIKGKTFTDAKTGESFSGNSIGIDCLSKDFDDYINGFDTDNSQYRSLVDLLNKGELPLNIVIDGGGFNVNPDEILKSFRDVVEKAGLSIKLVIDSPKYITLFTKFKV